MLQTTYRLFDVLTFQRLIDNCTEGHKFYCIMKRVKSTQIYFKLYETTFQGHHMQMPEIANFPNPNWIDFMQSWSIQHLDFDYFYFIIFLISRKRTERNEM